MFLIVYELIESVYIGEREEKKWKQDESMDPINFFSLCGISKWLFTLISVFHRLPFLRSLPFA